MSDLVNIAIELIHIISLICLCILICVLYRMVFFGNLKRNPIKGSIVDSAYNFLKDRLPYRVRRFLEDNGNMTIEKMWIYRQPITPIIDKLFNILSLGKFDEAKQKLGYDDLFHLYVVVQLSNDSRVLIEKNQNLHIGEPNPSKLHGEMIEVDMRGTHPTLLQLIEKTKKGMGDKAFYTYTAFQFNCQNLIYEILKNNGLLSNENLMFVMQKSNELLRSLPAYTDTLANVATDTASYINRFIQAIGLKGFESGGLV